MDNQIIIYQTEDGQTRVDVRMENETVWLTQAQMAELFQKDIPKSERVFYYKSETDDPIKTDEQEKGEEVRLPEGYEFVPQITPYYDAVSETIVWIGSRTERYPTPDGFTSETDYYIITTNTKENTVSYQKITPYSGWVWILSQIP